MSDFCNFIRKAIEERAKQIAEEQVKEAVAKFDKQLREAIPVVACSVAHYYQVQEYNNRIVITINHPPKVQHPRVGCIT